MLVHDLAGRGVPGGVDAGVPPRRADQAGRDEQQRADLDALELRRAPEPLDEVELRVTSTSTHSVTCGAVNALAPSPRPSPS